MPPRDPPLTPAQRRRVEAALPMVDKIAARMRRRVPALTLDELRSAGHLALVRCVHRYDPESGTPFGTFAYARVAGAMLDERDRMHPELRRYRRALKRLEATHALGREFADTQPPATHHDPRTLRERVDAAAHHVGNVTTAVLLTRLVPLPEGGADALTEPAPDPEALATHDQLRARLLHCLEQRDPDQQVLLRALYREDRSLRSIARDRQVSDAKIRREHARAIRAMSECMAA